MIHAGDFTNFGDKHEITDFLQWLDTQTQFKDIIYIAGNHDIGYRSIPHNKLTNCTNLHYLHDPSICIKGINFYGTPYTPRFFDWVFIYDPPEATAIWSRIPQKTNVLISHGPPYGVLDQCPGHLGQQASAGCPALLDTVERLQSLQLHVFGHIHESHGVLTHENGRVSVNAASIYGSIRYPPIEIDIKLSAEPVQQI